MVTPQLSVRSSKARDLAHKLARRENRTIADIVERALESYEAREADVNPLRNFTAVFHRSRVRISISTVSSMKTDALTKASSFDFLDTNVMSETLKKAPDSAVIAWLVRHDAELALPTIAVAEIAFGIKDQAGSAR